MTDRMSSGHTPVFCEYFGVFMYSTWGWTKKDSPKRKRLGTFSYGWTCNSNPQYKDTYFETIEDLVNLILHRAIRALNEEWTEAVKLGGIFYGSEQLIGLPSCAANGYKELELCRGSKKRTVVRKVKKCCIGWRLWMWMPKNEKPSYEWREDQVILRSFEKGLEPYTINIHALISRGV